MTDSLNLSISMLSNSRFKASPTPFSTPSALPDSSPTLTFFTPTSSLPPTNQYPPEPPSPSSPSSPFSYSPFSYSPNGPSVGEVRGSVEHLTPAPSLGGKPKIAPKPSLGKPGLVNLSRPNQASPTILGSRNIPVLSANTRYIK